MISWQTKCRFGGGGWGGLNKTRQKAFLDQLVRFSPGIIYDVIGSFSAAVMEEGGGLLPGAEQRK